MATNPHRVAVSTATRPRTKKATPATNQERHKSMTKTIDKPKRTKGEEAAGAFKYHWGAHLDSANGESYRIPDKLSVGEIEYPKASMLRALKEGQYLFYPLSKSHETPTKLGNYIKDCVSRSRYQERRNGKIRTRIKIDGYAQRRYSRIYTAADPDNNGQPGYRVYYTGDESE